MSSHGAIVILSGGQDSTTCLYWAKHQLGRAHVGHGNIHAITFDYGQRHDRELGAARKVADLAGVATHEEIDVRNDVLRGASPLINDAARVEHYDTPDDMPGGIEPTFVPARNALFLTIAANRAAMYDVDHIVLGVCEADYGGYPDCRRAFIDAMEGALSLGILGEAGKDPNGARSFMIHTPLMYLNKAQSVRLAKGLPGCWEALAYTHTCYDGQFPPNPSNHASMLRARGFHDAGFEDPLIVRAKSEGLLPDDYPRDGYVVGTEYQRVDSEIGEPG